MATGIHITGASGSGTTTLGRALAERFGLRHLDTDDYLWEPTDPPYSQLRSKEDRLRLLGADLHADPRWVLSGSLARWGDPLLNLFELVVFLVAPTVVRLERLRRRERARFGVAAISPGGAMHQHHLEFLHWAAQYDEGGESVRSLRLHEAWLPRLPCPVLRINGELTTSEQVEHVLRYHAERSHDCCPCPSCSSCSSAFGA